MSGYYKITFLRPYLTDEHDEFSLRQKFSKREKVFQLTKEQFELMEKTDMLPRDMLKRYISTAETAVRELQFEGLSLIIRKTYHHEDDDHEVEDWVKSITWTELPVLKYKKIAELEDE